jgi:glycosyltransferase involved in cell wall biosynthesis
VPTPSNGGSLATTASSEAAPATLPGEAGPSPGKRREDVKIAVVMPAMNAARTLERTVSAIPDDWADDVLLVDDKSTDETVEVARRLPIRVIWHPHNVGYGANQKTCYLDALQHDADIVVMLHPDGQYEPTLIPALVAPILRGEADLVLGSRLAEPGMARAGGMPLYKYVSNRCLTTLENAVMRTHLTDLHTGYRAYSRELLLTVPFLRNSLDFAFDSEMLLQAAHFGFRIVDVPARSIYFDDASSISFWPASVYGLKTVWQCSRLMLHRSHVVRSAKFRP